MHSCSLPSGTPFEESAALERPGLGVVVTVFGVANSPSVTSSGRGTGENGVTSDASLAALVACKDRVCKDRVCGPEFRCLPQAPPFVSCRGARLVAQPRGTLCGEAGERRPRSLRKESGHPELGRGHLR